MTITRRVARLREWMQANGMRAYLIPTADPHNDEYIPAHWMCREWITGFTGSAGLAVVTLDRAALWTDSRYWLQAEEELKDTPYELMRDGAEGVLSPVEWVLQVLGNDAGEAPCMYCPGEMLTLGMSRDAQSQGLELKAGADAFDALWTDRPALPAGEIVVQPAELTGMSLNEKLNLVRSLLDRQTQGKDYLFNDLSDIAWILNLRGQDIPYNPVFVSYLLYQAAESRFTLFTHIETLTDEARTELQGSGVACAPYADWTAAIQGKSIAFDFGAASCLLHTSADDLDLPSPVEKFRACKNAAECDGFREAMLRDGVALVQFMRWLDESMAKGERVTEISADEKLTALRAAQPGFRDLSFATIAGYGPHGAIVHYEATPETDVQLEPHGLLLLDSGAQYDCGTTDITRTIALGPLTDEEKRVYTLVFKGHLGLSRLHFPDGATGLQLDTAARADMWAAGYDFGHGTGHGVGSHLCVHEGPHQIRKDLRACTLVPFRAGMTITDEPGIYVAGRFGVRIENVLLCVPDRTTDFGRFLKFENLTLCPYDLRPVDRSMLTPVEVDQINAYHTMVRERLMPLLIDEADRNWLEKATAAL